MHDGNQLKKFIAELPIKVKKVEELTGIKRPTIYTHFVKQKLDISIKDKYRESIGINWESDKLPNKNYEATPIYKDVIEVPVVEKRAKAGYIMGYSDPVYVESLRKTFVPKEFEKGNYLVFEIDGNSMNDDTGRSLNNRDLVLAKELDKSFWKEKLYYKQYLFIIVTEDDVLCKQIIDHNVNNGEIVCHSFNPAYDDFKLNLKDVYQLFYLIKIVEKAIIF